MFPMPKYFNIRALLLLITLITLSSTHSRHHLNSTQTSRQLTPRTQTLYMRCPVPRIPFYDSQRNESQSVARIQTGAALKVDGDQLIYNLLNKNDSGAKQQINKSMGSIVLYVIFMAIGLVLTVVLGFVMICCCMKPDKCPPCLACRYPEFHVYTNCQRKWPAVAIIVLASIIIGTMIAVLVINPRLQKGYSETRCSTAMFFDDLLNGNYTRDGKQYFVGLKPLNQDFVRLSSEIQNILSNVQNMNLSSAIDGLLGKLGIMQHKTSDIPRGDGTERQLKLKYVSPINSPPGTTSPQTTTIQSTLEPVLGSKNKTFSLIGQTYTSLSMLKHTLMSITDISQAISKNIPKISQTMQTGLQKYQGLVTQVQDMDKKTDQRFETYQKSYVTPVSVIIYVLASIAIVFSIVLIVATLFLCLKNQLRCTKVLYSACAVLTFIGVVFFVLSIGLSAATGVTHYGCSYLEVGLQNKSQFSYRFGPLIDNKVLMQLVSQCATKQSSGIIIDPTVINQALKNTHQAAKHMKYLSADRLSHFSTSSTDRLLLALHSYHSSETLDIDSITDISILQNLSNPALFNCSAPGFSQDSWVPTTNQDGIYVDCKIAGAGIVTKQTCQNKESFEARDSEGCKGCINTFSILQDFTNYNQVLNSLQKRYPDQNCKQFNTQLANTWYNYYYKKSQVLAPALHRAEVASEGIKNLSKQFHGRFQEKLQRQFHHLQLNLETITDPNQALATNVSCQVLGQDIALITNTFCTQIFNYAFSMRILSIIAGFSILVTMIVATFYGVRVWKNLGVQSVEYVKNDKDVQDI